MIYVHFLGSPLNLYSNAQFLKLYMGPLHDEFPFLRAFYGIISFSVFSFFFFFIL